MKPRLLAAALALLAAFAATGRADEFSDLAHSPGAYWVPASVTYAPPPGYYGGPPPGYYYAPPPPPPPPIVGGLFFHFHFH
ncbi:MAG TPA: hypothetical protein VHY09_04000 [Candidatus Methylacidiphilales bacterium]|jgi:hypothetical protein|nr:hypothetical protein [Candidatus Methylacidiphilales bacterium]